MACDVKEELKEVIKDLRSNQESEEVYHYTSINGLLGILSSNTLWMNATHNFRDHTEIIHGKKQLLITLIENNFSGAELSAGINFLDNASLICTSSFSKNKEEPLMWKYYSDDFKGAVIKFNKKLFGPNGDKFWTEDFMDVTYDEELSKKNFIKMIDIYKSGDKKCPCNDHIGHLTSLFLDLLWYIAFIKHPYFEYENESRFVHVHMRDREKTFFEIPKDMVEYPPEKNGNYVLLKNFNFSDIEEIFFSKDSYPENSSERNQLIKKMEEETSFTYFNKINFIPGENIIVDDLANSKRKLSAPPIKVI